MDKEYIIIVYIRISMEDRDIGTGGKEESNSIVNQRNLLHSFIGSKREFDGCKVIELCDDGYTGLNFDRPAVQKLLQQAQEKTVDCIIVKDFSRLGRDYLVVSDYIDQLFPLLGIRFIAINDGYDSAGLNGTTSGFDMAFRNVVYAYYSKDISEKVRSGKRAKAQQGAYLSPFAPIGYRKDKTNKNHLVVEEQSADIVHRIFRMCGAGLSVMEITRLLNAEKVPTPSQLKNEQGIRHKWWEKHPGREYLWDTSTITRILRDERYLGTAVYGRKTRREMGNYRVRKNSRENWIVVPGSHQPIVTENEFEAAQQTLRHLTEVNNRKTAGHLFTGKIRCKSCGYAMICEGKIKPGYRCMTKKRTSECGCMEGRIEEAALVETVWQVLQLYCRTLLQETEDGKRKSGKDRLTAIEKQVAVYQASGKNLDEQQAILYEQKLEGRFSRGQYCSRRDKLLQQQHELQDKISKLEGQLLSIREHQRAGTLVAKDINNYLGVNGLKREMVMAFVDCIYVYNAQRVRIKWLFHVGGER